MTSPSERYTSHFEVIPESRCKELLAVHTAGRIGWNAPDGPEILPVTYAYHNNEIVFRTSPHGVLSSLERRMRVPSRSTRSTKTSRPGGTSWSAAQPAG